MKKVFISSILLAATLFGQCNNENQQGQCNDVIATNINYELGFINSVIPNTKISKYELSEIQGYYKVFLENGQMFYVNPITKLIIFGEVWTNKGYSFTQNDLKNWQEQLLQSNLINKYKVEEITSAAKKLKHGKGSKKYEFVIFTDPECPFCKTVEDYFAKTNVDLHIVFKPLPFHKNAKEWSLKALSSPDLKKALEDIKNNNIPEVAISDKALKELQSMEELSTKLNVTGTPKIIVIDKLQNKIVDAIDGAQIPKIEKYQKENN